MATFTPNLNLEKPAQEDFYNVDVQNANMDKIDATYKTLYGEHNKPNPEDIGAATEEMVDEAKNAASNANSAASTAQSNLNAHIGNKSNPHGVTKSQVGLGNVPNVATNDQTPTYSAASTLTGLTSGEKLSVAFGKIMKAIADFITHKGSTSNPHGVTKAQVGLGNVDNTNDASKPISAATQSALDGKAPKSHAASATTYGIGTGSNYGHVKLSDSTGSSSAASAGIAASPKAVKAAYDWANEAKKTADAALPTEGGTLTGKLMMK